MTPLDRKLVRDLWHLRGQVAAISLVVVCGIAAVVTERTAYRSLLISQEVYYSSYRFADVFAQLKRAPEGLVPRLQAIPGVQAVQTRVVKEVTLDVPGLEEPATGRLISIPERRAPMLNDLHLRRGRYLESGRRDEVLVGEGFAEANGLAPGDSLGAVINGRWERLRIVGVVLSPEYVYEIRGGDIFPDPRRFGVLWMSREALGPAFDMEGAFNDVTIALAPGASEQDVIARVDHLLERYGGLGAHGRVDQMSNRFLSDEIAETKAFGTFLPAVFLSIAAFLLNIVLARLVGTQRDQIAVLKAFGYDNRTVGLHYLKLAVAALLAGGLAGTVLGIWLGAWVNEVYARYFRFPVFRYEVDAGTVLLAILVTTVAALLGALGAVRRAVTLPPAEAMRPEPPAGFRAGLIEWLRLQRVLAPPGRAIVRNLERWPVKAVLSTVGIALAVAILIVGRFFLDAVRHIADVQFRLVQRENITVVFNGPRPARSRDEVARLEGVLRSEPFRAVPARLRHEYRNRRVEVLGLERSGDLRHLVDRSLRTVHLPPDGLVLTTRLGQILGVGPGDTLTVEVLEGGRPVRQVPVAGLVDELIGLSAYMDRSALNRLMGEGRTISGAFLAVDAPAAPGLYALLKRVPAVAGVADRDATLASFHDTLARSIGIFTTILIILAGGTAFAMVYNTARIALSERGRELASLRVLGFTRGEIAVMLLGEQVLLTLIAVPLGFTIGYWICAFIAQAYERDLWRLPLVISEQTYAYATIVVAVAALVSGLVVRRRLDRLDLVAVLKTRE